MSGTETKMFFRQLILADGEWKQLGDLSVTEGLGGWPSAEVAQKELLKRGYQRVKFGNGVEDTEPNPTTGVRMQITFE